MLNLSSAARFIQDILDTMEKNALKIIILVAICTE